MSSKRCTKCGEVKPLGGFYKNSRNKKDGRASACKDCNRLFVTNNRKKIAEYKRKHYVDNREKIAERGCQRYANNREKIAGYNRAHYADNREKRKEAVRQYQIDNPEKVRASRRRHYIENVERYKIANHQWCIDNPEKVRAYKRKWVADNPEKRRAAVRKWDANNPDKIRAYYINNMGKFKTAARKRGRSNSANITDLYIRKILVGSVANIKNPSVGLVELKRQHIIAKRLIRELKRRIKDESNNPNV